MMNVQKANSPFLYFGMSAALIVAVCVVILRSNIFASNPTLMAMAICFDLSITIPFLYYCIVVRRGIASATTLVPVLLGGLYLAHALLPGARHPLFNYIWLLIVPLEVFAIVMLVRRVFRYVSELKESDATSSDPFEKLELGARRLWGENRLVDMAMAEVSVFYYAFLSWRTSVAVIDGKTAITCHKKSNWLTVLIALFFLITLEGAVVHVVLSQWNPLAAWGWFACDLYAIVWLIADYRAFTLRPMLLAHDHLFVRFGMRWTGTVSFDNIRVSVAFSKLKRTPEGKDYLNLSLASDPDIFLVLKGPVEFRGLFGLRRMVRRLGIQTDDPNLLERLQSVTQNTVPSV